MDGFADQKSKKERLVLGSIFIQMELREIHKTSHLSTEEYILFSRIHRPFSSTDHALGNVLPQFC